ncbi:MAG: zinc-dependent alcohol dehydrogenase family protein [Desulfobacterales bacterium]|jgi:alcohol dehydrogenase
MKAAVYEDFGNPLAIQELPDPTPPVHGAVIRVRATGICRSDWHAWQGHDPDVQLPQVPGHEFSGTVEEVGAHIRFWKPGDRVTLPFVCGCGRCPQCQSGHHQVCDHQFQPGFTHWGSFAERVAVHYADINLVRLPEAIDDSTAASLGCRFTTAFRAVATQGRTGPGDWVAVFGCGGVGLSAIMIAESLGARTVGIDIRKPRLNRARSLGARAVIDAAHVDDVVQAVRDITHGGAHVSIDALGSPETCFNAVSSLRKRGRHVQVGLLLGDDRTPSLPMDRVVAHELEILGSHGIQAHAYPAILAMIASGKLQPEKLVGQTVSLAEGIQALHTLGTFSGAGITVINRFD